MPDDIERIACEVESLHRLIETMEKHRVITSDGVDVTARELASVRQIVAGLDLILLRLSQSVH